MTKEEYADLLTEIAGEEVFGIEGKVDRLQLAPGARRRGARYVCATR
jgi:hypothetical protein